MRTSFHHQPEAQHPQSPATYKLAGRLPHLLALNGRGDTHQICPLLKVDRTCHRATVTAHIDPACVKTLCWI